MRYLLRLEDGKSWEDVNQHVFNNRKFAVLPDGSRRYNDDFIQVLETGHILINGLVSVEELGKICRLLSINLPNHAYAPIVKEPESVEIHKGRQKYLHQLKTNENWVRKAA